MTSSRLRLMWRLAHLRRGTPRRKHSRLRNKTVGTVTDAVNELPLLDRRSGAKRRGGCSSAKLETEDQKTLYALGLLIGRNVKPFALKPEELAIVKSGLTDSVTGAKPQVELETYGPKVNELADRRSSVGADETKKKG